MKKRLTAVLLCGLMTAAAALSGCGSSASTSGSSAAQSSSGSVDASKAGLTDPNDIKGDLRLSVWGSDAEIECDNEVINAFMQKYPNCKVELEVINDDYLTKVETEMLANDAPDVIYGHPKYFQKWASQGLLLDLTPYFNNHPELLDSTHYATDIYDAFTYQDKYYSTVNGADTTLLFYNQKLFDEAGVPYPSDSWTWDDFLSACSKLTKDTNGDGVTDQYAISSAWSHENIQAFMAAYGGEIYDDVNNPTKVTIAGNDADKKGLQMMYDLTFKYNYAPTSEQSEALSGGFDTGQIAMDLGGVYNIVYRSAQDGGLDFPYGLAKLPQVGADAHSVALMAGYCVPKSEKNPEAAWALASFMESETGQKLLAKSGLITVINKDIASSDEVINIPNAPANHMLRVTSLEGAVNVDAKLPNWQETLDTGWQPAIDQLWNGDTTVDETLQTLQTNLTNMLSQN